MVIRALLVDHPLKASLPLVVVVGDIRHEVGIASLALAHHAVFIVAKVSGAKPERVLLIVGMASRAQCSHGVFNRPAVVQGRLEEILIKNYLKGAEILILLPSQTGHGKIPDCVEILNIARTGDDPVCGLNCLPGREGPCNVFNIRSLIAIFWPVGIIGGLAPGPSLNRQCQIVDLLPGVVVIKLPVDPPTGGLQQSAE